MAARNFDDWLSAFVHHTSLVGEAPLHVLYWVAVSTIAGALRRKVWIDEINFEWVPNFYIVTVAEPGIISKTTTANVGFNMLRQVEGIHFGPDIVSWQRLVEKMGEEGEQFDLDGVMTPMHAMTCAVDELGNFIDPEDDKQISALIALWDGKRGVFEKETKTQGSDKLTNPWLNIFACTTPNWLGRNFPEAFLDSGLFSRMIWLRADDKRQRVSLPSRIAPAGYQMERLKLVADLQKIATLTGPFRITPAASDWADKHYNSHWDKFTGGANSREWMGYPARKQTHMFKLAMVISASRGEFPVIDVSHLAEADARLTEIEPHIQSVFHTIGAKEIPKASQEIVAALRQMGGTAFRRDVYGKHFFRRLPNKDFDEALRGAIAAGLIDTSPNLPLRLMLTKAGSET